jgi:deoxyadenosine/deoxycytidine kinase
MAAPGLLVITGPIASGKSTIGSRVGAETGLTFFPEDVDSHPADRDVLERYYRAVEAFESPGVREEPGAEARLRKAREDVYETQVHFIRKRAAILRRITAAGRPAVVERHPWDDLHVFSRRNLDRGLLAPEQYEALCALAEREIAGCPAPRLIVFLCADADSLRRRIRKRGRPQERDLLNPNNPYLAEIAALYEAWYSAYSGEKFRLETDWLTEEEVVQRIVGEFRCRRITLVGQGT